MDDYFIGFSTAGKYGRLSPSLMHLHEYFVQPALADICTVHSALRLDSSRKRVSAPGSCKSRSQFTR